MPSDLPKAPAAVIYSGVGQFWVEETAARVRELRSEALAGIGEDDGNMVLLTGLESTGKSGDEGLISYVLALEPHQIVAVRSMSQAGFENLVAHLGGHQQEEPTVPSRSSGPMKPEVITPDVNIGLECCCGHRLGSHDLSGGEGQNVGACQIDGCPCELFHTHG